MTAAVGELYHASYYDTNQSGNDRPRCKCVSLPGMRMSVYLAGHGEGSGRKLGMELDPSRLSRPGRRDEPNQNSHE